MQRYPILFLNGTSSSGKTSLARAFQKLWHEPVLYTSNDAFIFMLADHVLKDDAARRPVLGGVLMAFHRSLSNLADCGLPMIVDHVIEIRQWLCECVQSLTGYDVLFVGVRCPVDELERRERVRGDREIGFARMQYDRVHRFGAYDYEIDTHLHSPEQGAEQLRDLLLSGQKGEAFARLRIEFSREKT